MVLFGDDSNEGKESSSVRFYEFSAPKILFLFEFTFMHFAHLHNFVTFDNTKSDFAISYLTYMIHNFTPTFFSNLLLALMRSSFGV